MYYLRTKRTAGGVRTNNALELSPVGSARLAFSCHAGCGAAGAPAATNDFTIIGPVQLNFVC